jgi:L-ascorbate metabolism protein UlaG (beta-lactamase superfamily)
MSVEQAADAVLAFKPKQVYPYHYRTPTGFSDVGKFKQLVNAGNPNIEVIQLDWYPQVSL